MMRFSVRTLFIITAVAAVFCGLFFAVPDSASVPLLTAVAFWLLSSAAALATVARGAGRVFGLAYAAAGSWMPVGAGFVVFYFAVDDDFAKLAGPEVDEDLVFALKCTYGFQIAASIIAGLLAIGIRWYCLRRESIEPADAASISPRDMAELYAVLQGRMGNGVDATLHDATQLTTGNTGTTG